jgi:L-ribulokinase
VSVPASAEIPARGAALFGALAAGSYASIAQALEATRPRIGRAYRPDARASAVYERVYAIYRELYDVLGRSDAAWLHGLKRIRTELHGG